MDMRKLTSLMKEPLLIQGGNFRLDKGPTKTEILSFSHAINFYQAFLRQKNNVRLGCLVNDFGLPADKRPKKYDGISILAYDRWPLEYLALLEGARIPVPNIKIFYESSLRNRVRTDFDHGRIRSVGLKESETGLEVATCPAIMGCFYSLLAKHGFKAQFGLYVKEPKCSDDHSCEFGPVRGALYDSGYDLKIDVLNYWVLPDGELRLGGYFEP